MRGGLDLGWVGAGLSVAPFMAVVGYLMLMQSKARTSRDLPVATALSLSGALVAIIAGVKYDAHPIAVAWAIAGAAKKCGQRERWGEREGGIVSWEVIRG